ncbi:hypothetical protein M2323_002295 [Rhodoblastus acidophilus]|nr:hypothetical protein [Rhodoblastus acidophilus]MCW2333361.1 hypothetical protein [Rhodoblastus acidophilus]
MATMRAIYGKVAIEHALAIGGGRLTGLGPALTDEPR